MAARFFREKGGPVGAQVGPSPRGIPMVPNARRVPPGRSLGHRRPERPKRPSEPHRCAASRLPGHGAGPHGAGGGGRGPLALGRGDPSLASCPVRFGPVANFVSEREGERKRAHTPERQRRTERYDRARRACLRLPRVCQGFELGIGAIPRGVSQECMLAASSPPRAPQHRDHRKLPRQRGVEQTAA